MGLRHPSLPKGRKYFIFDQRSLSRPVKNGVKFVTLSFTEQSVKVVGATAIVRHTMTSDVIVQRKPIAVRLLALPIWQKQGTKWRLLARQAVTAPRP